ncbi:uncharacterized protein LOC129948211 [Eupeodes corollae]|uniref:uncharacterized protein LOC129948211 n=1 Tax=Eupeodes corollae TaxID=290404 RepID=UPI00248FC728|nr:uncharacterized protein LOC129948211 [Eupeodes corollae]
MSKFNADELHAPSWMNEEFFTEVLRKCEKTDKISVKEIKISPASAQGDHYASVMFRGVIIYDTPKSKENSKSLIIKTMPESDGHKKDMLGESYIFETEISMYSETIPKFEAELRKIGDKTVLGANLLYYSLEPRKVIIFEDICPKGYTVLRDRQCTMEEVKASLLKLAKWHAVSYKLASEGDTSVTGYKESFLAFKGAEEMPIFTTGMENFINKLETVDDLKHFVPQLRAIKKDVLKRSINSARSGQEKGLEGIFVLCHGDFHRKNLMFKHSSNGELEDVLLIDFQVCNYGPAVLDIIYIMYMLISEDMRTNHYDEIIYFYCSSFIECLKKLKFQGQIPKISDFFIDILRHKHFELFMMSSFLPIWNAFAFGDVSPDDLMSSNDARKKVYDNENYISEIRRLLPKIFYRGYLEINNLDIKPASAKGDHYASVMFRATINYDTNNSKGLSKSMIIKIAPELDGHKKDMLQKSSVFETEIGMYSNTIPKFEEELRKIGDNTVLGARALYYSLEPKKCIIFEDIVPKGYEVLRDRQLNLEETKATLTKLAKWHAVSYKLALEGDESVTNYEHGIFSPENIDSISFLGTGLQYLIEKLETLDDLKQYVPKLRLIEKDLLKNCIKSSRSYRNENAEGIFALCHGDFHGKNLMFKRNSKNQLEDVMLIDFQACYFGPAVMDIMYGMYMIIDDELRINHFDEIIHHYSSNFINTLKSMKFEGKIPQVFEFFTEILRHRHMELFMLSTFVPMWYGIEVDVMEIEDLLFSVEKRKKLYDAPGYIKQIRRVLPQMLHRGYLE